MPLVRVLCTALALTGLAASASAQEGPGLDALERFRQERQPEQTIENRFFLKEGRFEVAPLVAYVPNNPFAKRFVGGLLVGYHFNEQFSAQGEISYSPDLGEADLKDLTTALVVIAHGGPGGADFQQPLDKVTLAATFGGTWAPIYGKINLIGETVLNFDFYGSAGLGIISKKNYFATYGDSQNPVVLEGGTNEVKLTPTVGFGADFFLSQTVALKLDARFAFYVDNQPQYCSGAECPPVTEQRLYNTFTIGSGLSFFFPKMKPRIYDF